MSERVARLRIELQELEPKIWRRIDMPLSTTLETLHEAIQMTMGWTFSHLWEFDIDGRCYGDPSFREFDDEPPIYKAKGLRLGVLIARGVEQFVYTYDFGDNWRHDVIVEEVRDGDPEWSIQPSWAGPGAVRRRTAAARTVSWTSWRRSSIRRTSNTGTWSAGTADRSTRSAWTRSGRGSAWRTWCAGGAARWPATGAGRGDRKDDRGSRGGRADRRGRFRPKIAKRCRRHSGTVLSLKKSAFALMTDFEKAGILTKIAGKDCYISTQYRLSSEMRSVNGGAIMYGGKILYHRDG